MNNSICLILPYFGKFHPYFSRWLQSAGHNKSIDFLVFTDDHTSYDYPGNVHVEYCSFSDFANNIQAAFDFPIALSSPYKLCDFKPTYGLVLKDYISKYNFWGHCDCDLIFGDIRSFLTDDILNSFDRILSRGHLSIYRNSCFTNQFFMRERQCVNNWKKVLSSNQSFAYDEWAVGTGVSELWRQEVPDRMYDKIVFDDINPMYKHFVSSQKVLMPDETNKDFFIFYYCQGSLSRISFDYNLMKIVCEPTCYVHFQKRSFDDISTSQDEYFIVPNAFIDVETLDEAKLRRWGKHRLLYSRYFKIRYQNILRKLKGYIF